MVTICVSLKHLRPVKSTRLLVRGLSCKHRHAVLVWRHGVVRELRVDVRGHGVRDSSVVALIEAAGPRVVTHHGTCDTASVAVVRVFHTVHAGLSGQVVLVVRHVRHAILSRDQAERVHHPIRTHVAHAVNGVELVLVTHSLLLGSLVLLDVRMRVREMACSSGVATADRAFLEVALENIATGEGVAAQDTHVRAVAGVSQKMPLEMLGVQVRLVTMRARELPVGILLGDLVLCRLAASDRGLGPTRRAREDSSATLRANHMCRRVAFLLHH